MTEEFIKGLSTEHLLHNVITLIDAHVALAESPDNSVAINESRALLMMISKEIAARNTPIQ